MGKFDLEVLEDYGIIEEHKNSNKAIVLRKASWGGRTPKVEIREVEMESNTSYKGIGLYSEQGLENLALAIIKAGFVDVKKLESAIVDLKKNKKEVIDITESIEPVKVLSTDDLTDY